MTQWRSSRSCARRGANSACWGSAPHPAARGRPCRCTTRDTTFFPVIFQSSASAYVVEMHASCNDASRRQASSPRSVSVASFRQCLAWHQSLFSGLSVQVLHWACWHLGQSGGIITPGPSCVGLTRATYRHLGRRTGSRSCILTQMHVTAVGGAAKSHDLCDRIPGRGGR